MNEGLSVLLGVIKTIWNWCWEFPPFGILVVIGMFWLVIMIYIRVTRDEFHG